MGVETLMSEQRTATESVLELEGVTVRFGGVVAVRDVSLSIREGELFGLIGPNGAGKTTTIRLLLDFIRPTIGKASVLGLDSRRDSREIRKRVDYLPGDMALYEKMTGSQLLRYLASLRGGVDWKFVDEVVQRLECDLSRPIKELSKGNKQKVGLVQAFMQRPELLLMDEPTSGLDPLIQQEFYGMVDDLRANGSTVFMSSHNIAEVERVCDRIGIIRRGTLVAVEAVQTLKERAVHQLEFHFSTAISETAFNGMPGIRDLKIFGNVLSCTMIGKPDVLLKRVAQFEVVKLVTHEPSLEDIFLSYYEEGDNAK